MPRPPREAPRPAMRVPYAAAAGPTARTGSRKAQAVDLNMLALLTVRERTESEYLRGAGGFEMERVIPAHFPFSIIEASRVSLQLMRVSCLDAHLVRPRISRRALPGTAFGDHLPPVTSRTKPQDARVRARTHSSVMRCRRSLTVRVRFRKTLDAIRG
jgi:hypothetical protein